LTGVLARWRTTLGASSSLDGTSKTSPLGEDGGEAVLGTDLAREGDFSFCEAAAEAEVDVERSSG